MQELGAVIEKGDFAVQGVAEEPKSRHDRRNHCEKPSSGGVWKIRRVVMESGFDNLFESSKITQFSPLATLVTGQCHVQGEL